MYNLEELSHNLTTGLYDNTLNNIYVDKSLIEPQKNRYTHAINTYKDIFGKEDKVCLFSAPGRSEVCGNHTDHQHGMVLATSINLDLLAVVSESNSDSIKLLSDGYDMIEIKLSDLSVKESEYGSTASLIRGMAKGFRDRGLKIGGFCAYITGNIPVGAGLSSSAAFEVLIGTIFSGLFNNMSVDPVEIAIIAQFAENIYFNKPCGLMDQMACSVGGMINIDFVNPSVPIVNKVNTDFEQHRYSLCIVDTKGSHVDLTDEYASIPNDMKKVAKFFGKDFLRDCNSGDFFDHIAELREKLDDRAILRALHFFEEENNVQKAVSYLNGGEFEKFLKIINKSGNSSFKYLQNVYVSGDVQKQNMSVALGISEHILGDNGVCRVHGGGFAGTIQTFVKNNFADKYKSEIEKIFGKDSCYILKIRKYGGIKVI